MLIAILAQSPAHLMEYSGAADVFSEATFRSEGRADYTVHIVAETADPIVCLSGAKLLPDRTIRDSDEAVDTLIITGAREPLAKQPSPALLAWIRRNVAVARRWGSVCTGAFLLGAAGLLEGRHVTTHWAYTDQLAKLYPAANVERDPIFLRDGPMFSSAGVSASIDLSLALLEEDHGRELALAVARYLVVYLRRPGGQSQFSEQLAAQANAGSPIEKAQAWVRDHPRANLSNPRLAKHAGMSERNFTRVFRQETGISPAEFVESTRVDAARRLLENTGMTLKQVATASGFSGVDALRRAFLKRAGVSPTDYRSRFRSSEPGQD